MRALPRAEQATLGALLLHPEPLPAVTEWLRAGDFADPWHGQLYAVLRERLVARQPITPEDAGMHLLDRVGPHKADLPRIASLLASTPPGADPRRYAPMVLEASLRREVAGQGVIVRASALATFLSGGSGPVEAGVAQVGKGLREAERRWQLASVASEVTAQPRPLPDGPQLDRRLAADRFLSAYPAVDGAAVRENEARLVAALVCHPDQATHVSAWLRPDMLVDRTWRAAYAAFLDLSERRQPVDAMTVAWQVQRATALHGAGPDPVVLSKAVDAALSDDPNFLSRRVAADLVRRTADGAAKAMEQAAGNLGLDVPEVLESARLVCEGVLAAAVGLQPPTVEGRAVRHLNAVQPRKPLRPETIAALGPAAP